MVLLGFPRSCAINLLPTETFCISLSQNNWEENYVHVISLEKVLIIQGSVQWDIEIHYF